MSEQSPRPKEEGDVCDERECRGVFGYDPVENCYCHVSPPCSACVDNPLVCGECGKEESIDHE